MTRPRPKRSSPWLVTAIATGAILGTVTLLVWWRMQAGLHDPEIVHGTVQPGDGDPFGPGRIKLADVVLRLVDETGYPVGDAFVILDGENGANAGDSEFPPAGGRTDELGMVRFTSVPFGHWPVLIPDPRLALARGRLLAVGSDETEPGSTIEYDVVVERQTAIRGRVVDRDNRPVPYVGLALHVDPPSAGIRQQVAKTDAEGAFEFYLPNGANPTVRAELTSPAHRPAGDQRMTFEVGTTPIEIVVELAPNPTIG